MLSFNQSADISSQEREVLRAQNRFQVEHGIRRGRSGGLMGRLAAGIRCVRLSRHVQRWRVKEALRCQHGWQGINQGRHVP